MGLVAITGVRGQVLERPPVLHVRREIWGLPSQEAALGFRRDLCERLRHGREEPQIPGPRRPTVDPRAGGEDDEVPLDRGGRP